MLVFWEILGTYEIDDSKKIMFVCKQFGIAISDL